MSKETDATAQALFEMLTENTGRAMCDSGGAYGRNHEVNAKRTLKSFQEEQGAWYEVYTPREGNKGISVSVTFSLFHWLEERLEYCPKLSKKLRAFGDHKSRADDSWFGIGKDWLESLRAKGPCGWGDNPKPINTYNQGGSCLSQVIQFTAFRRHDDESCYILLYVHGGCDVRSGYTVPRVFKLKGFEEFSTMLDHDSYRLEAWTDDVNTHWDRRDSNWHEARTPAAQKLVDKYGSGDLESFPFAMDVGQKRRHGTIYVSEDKTKLTCPITLVPLEAWPRGAC